MPGISLLASDRANQSGIRTARLSPHFEIPAHLYLRWTCSGPHRPEVGHYLKLGHTDFQTLEASRVRRRHDI